LSRATESTRSSSHIGSCKWNRSIVGEWAATVGSEGCLLCISKSRVIAGSRHGGTTIGSIGDGLSHWLLSWEGSGVVGSGLICVGGGGSWGSSHVHHSWGTIVVVGWGLRHHSRNSSRQSRHYSTLESWLVVPKRSLHLHLRKRRSSSCDWRGSLQGSKFDRDRNDEFTGQQRSRYIR
jgi:hypothetical protein